MRAIIIVLDGVGVGELPDADLYGDSGSNTIENINRKRKMSLPEMTKLGLADIDGMSTLPKANPKNLIGCYGKMAEKSKGKDTTTGHWELSGLITEEPFPTFPEGFSPEVLKAFQSISGKKALGNKTASGTEIIKELGKEHLETGRPIVYTSADSVLQIAAHENIIPIKELYRICEEMRKFLQAPNNVSRVIARPFIGGQDNFTRTKNRKDFSLLPGSDTLLTLAEKASYTVSAVGKIEDIFAMQGITDSVHTTNNQEGIEQTINYLETAPNGIIFTNLVDYDMLYGHRNDVTGFAAALEYFDQQLPRIVSSLKKDDILFITADHGCDPTTASTDHSREYVPLLVYGKSLKKGVNLHIRNSFADLAATIQEYLKIPGDIAGDSFLSDIIL